MPSALALNQVLWQVTGIVGPALAGLADRRDRACGWAYAVDLVSYGGMLIAALGDAAAAARARRRRAQRRWLGRVAEGFRT